MRDTSEITSSKSGRVTLGEPGPALAVHSNCVRNSLAINLIGVEGKAGHVVLRRVVVRVMPLPGDTTEDGNLLLSLDAVGTSVESTTGNAAVEERAIVAATAELGGSERDVVGSVVVLKKLFSLGRARWSGEIECASISIVDAQNVVGRSNHVEVEIQSHLLQLLIGRGIGISLSTH